MKLISWNVNGFRAVVKKGFFDSFDELDADIFCLQEIKMKEAQLPEIKKLDEKLEGYHAYYNEAEKAGYSGTAVFSKVEPLNVTYGLGIEEHDNEGRVITLEYEKFYLVNCYTPNSKRELERLEYRQVWEDDFREYLVELDKDKPVILCGDLNVAHKEIDLKNPKTNKKSAGFTEEERLKMTELLDAGFIDSFRYFYPEKEEEYSWWSYFRKSRDRNIGWRIDYFVVSEKLKDNMVDATIHQEILGSDHCPVEVTLNL